jgi:tetratricopeptide (TPR) repeat protein
MKNNELYRKLIIGKYDEVITELGENDSLNSDAAILALAYAIKHNRPKSLEILNTLDEENLAGMAKIAYYNSMAINSYQGKEYEKAMNFAEKSLAMNTNNFFALRVKGNVHTAKKEYTEALVCFQQILVFEPASEVSKYACTAIYWLQSNRQAALKMNATMKRSLKKYIDMLTILIFGDKKSIAWFMFFWMILTAIPFIRQIAFALFSLVFITLIFLSIIVQHRPATFSFSFGGVFMVLIYLINPLILLDNLWKLLLH